MYVVLVSSSSSLFEVLSHKLEGESPLQKVCCSLDSLLVQYPPKLANTRQSNGRVVYVTTDNDVYFHTRFHYPLTIP